ncbi:hypothetical protein BJY01DRAFT_257402 [Aspergillus pseudoustus]|uniref:F-box domain-containing protein n=1 Tax=Aspergillus pseudoustus TaxID=1810923 RepID=A0ABR4JK28_9EURO
MSPVRRSKRLETANSKGKAKDPPRLSEPHAGTKTAEPARRPHLLSLPREILSLIRNYLPPESEACLTLTCHEALERLGTTSWAEFSGKTRRHYGGINPLFSLLQRDLPGYLHCSTCDIMHPPLKPPSAHRRTRYTRNCFYDAHPVVDFWPQTEEGGGYSLTFLHICHARQPFATPPNVNPIAMFAGDFTFQTGGLEYRLVSTGRWVGMRRNIVLTQEHRLKSAMPGSPLRPADITALPFRVCAHLSTTTAVPPPVEQGRSAYRRNGEMLLHAITTAFPESLQGEGDVWPPDGTLRRLTPAEADQYREAAAEKATGNNYIWRCTACPTKFRVEYNADSAEGGELVVTAWHCFGGDPREQFKFWSMFALRTGPDLPPRKRNCEFFVTERQIPDFAIEYSGPIPCGVCGQFHEHSPT